MKPSNPLRILATLDRFLTHPFRLHLYGRSALALAFPDSPAAYHATMDVDAILPAGEVRAIEANEDFWRAQELTNQELGDTGLYFTHLFEYRQVILTPKWLDRTVPLLGFDFRHLELWRPSTADLVLTKMMRVDPQDREDIAFLLAQRETSRQEVFAALASAVVPEVPEIIEAFAKNMSWLHERLRNTI